MEEQSIDVFRGIILPYFNFFVFVGLAIFFFRKMAVGAAAKQKTDFEKLMNESRAARDAAVARLDELKRREAGLDKEIAEILSMSKAAADVDAAKIVSDAERLAAHLKEEAKRIAQAEVEKARTTLRREIVDAVTDAVAKKLKAEMNPESQLKLVKRNITQLGELKTFQAES